MAGLPLRNEIAKHFSMLSTNPPGAVVGFSEAKALRAGVVDSHLGYANVE
ncbi:hypothetical protein [Coleofasciculus sp. FACHB-1120]|nr:hypothetical protein [Coleofasciculus sp. FACHB-1120]MBD2741422.1 hypothetical protein [Coleofasciculus sp. FACHB-1120]